VRAGGKRHQNRFGESLFVRARSARRFCSVVETLLSRAVRIH